MPLASALPPPALVAADPGPLALEPAVPVGRAAYALRYALAGPPGATLLQRVETRVRLVPADVPADAPAGEDPPAVVAFEAVVWEYFTLARDGAEPRVDLHDFDARRDGWSPADLAALLRRLGRARPDGPLRLELEKSFLLGLGAVTGAAPAHVTARGGSFGLLVAGEDEPARAALAVGGAPAPARAAPAPRAGTGRFLPGPRLAAAERLAFTQATLSGRVTRSAYAPPGARSRGAPGG